eukprot:GEMP01018873.1.p1 GENE.GEMP01018873.1~~GEMP01018873.1.p1  ORF type:complete len:589 (+),score=141.13 GEMP01018873.1:152-1918(+)
MNALRALRPLAHPRRVSVVARHPPARYFCSATPSKASALATPEPAVSSDDTVRRGLAAGAAALILGGGYYVAAQYPTTTQPFELPEITDEIFDENDNLVVVVLDGEPSENAQRRITELRDFLHDTPALRHVRLYHTKQKPTGVPQAEGEEIRIMVYKGHRKEQTSFLDLPKEFIEKFFVARSEDPFPLRTEKGPQNIAMSQFDEMVIAPSFQQPVLVQVYEDTCFMCFLMRPFIESFAKLDDVPFLFRRLNIDRNDFPEGFPVARATPTFIVYNDGKAQKWDEFKPNDLAAKLDAMPVASSVKEQLNALLPKVQERFQMFTACVMLQIDLEKLQNKASLVGSEETDDKDNFESAVTAMMLADMQRTDDVEENLTFLENELKSLQEDVRVLADMLQVEVPPAARLRTAEHNVTAEASSVRTSDATATTQPEGEEQPVVDTPSAVDASSLRTSDDTATQPEGEQQPVADTSSAVDASSLRTSDATAATQPEGEEQPVPGTASAVDISSLRTSDAPAATQQEGEEQPVADTSSAVDASSLRTSDATAAAHALEEEQPVVDTSSADDAPVSFSKLPYTPLGNNQKTCVSIGF